MRKEISYNKIYKSKCGPFKILQELEHRKSGTIYKRRIRIQFILTGTIKDVDLLSALNGKVTDPYFNTVMGVACLGNYKSNPYHNKQIYDIWYHIIERCYNKNSKSYDMYGLIGIRVDPRWLCYENFLNDLQYITGFSEYLANQNIDNYELDKDLLQQNIPKEQRIYSKDTCYFISKHQNIQLMAKDNKNNCSSKYYGVYKTKYNTYQSTIMVNGKKHFIGTFKNEIDAAYAYNQVALSCNNKHNINMIEAIRLAN